MNPLRSPRIRRAGLTIVAAAALWFGWAVSEVVREPRTPEANPRVVDDVSQLNPIVVARVLAPTRTEEIVDAVRLADAPISIGGARHSMGGQIATAGSLHLDMRGFNRILALSETDKTIAVQAGATWRQIQERIDPANLSVAIMQSYANFTVGGSLSVNAHGRYVGVGPLVGSVRSIRVVLADGSLVDASPSVNSEIFYGVIGGYGGLGVITEATLALADNVAVRRRDEFLPVDDYRRYFLDRVQGSPAVFHNGDLYPDRYRTVHAVTYSATDDPVTWPDRLVPEGRSYRLNRLRFWIASEWPLGTFMRRWLVDPLQYRGSPVVWRNYEASYDTRELEPASRATSTYALQEYFVPIERFDEFVPRLREILLRDGVNIVNVSIRHATRDPGTILAWARTDVFAFVLYYKQGTSEAARAAVGAWTADLIDAALASGGSYYLPYQLHATAEQFHRAYPRANEWFALKRRLDPTNKFRNELWNRYGPLPAAHDAPGRPQRVAQLGPHAVPVPGEERAHASIGGQ